jgi:hypothetical protein
VSEYLATLDDAAYGAATPVIPKFVMRSRFCTAMSRRSAIGAMTRLNVRTLRQTSRGIRQSL